MEGGTWTKELGITLVVSALLYIMPLLGLFFTVPLIVGASRQESVKLGLIPVGIMAVVIIIRTMIAIKSAAQALVLFVPLALLIAAAVWILLRERRLLERFLAASLFPVIFGIALAIWLSAGGKGAQQVSSDLLKMFQDELILLGGAVAGSAEGVEQVTFLGLDSVELFSLFGLALQMMFLPLLMWLTGFTSMIAELFIHRGQADWNDRVTTWKLPENFVWGFLFSWLVLLLGMMITLPTLVVVVVSNVAFAMALLYAIQGFSIVLHLLRRRVPISALRLFVSAILFCMVPGLNLAVIGGLAILGVTETWIQYRKKR